MSEWRDVPGFPRYEVSSCGRIRAKRRGTARNKMGLELVPWDTVNPGHASPTPYLKVGLYRCGKRHRVFVHRIVCEAFHGRAPDGCTDVAHLDDDSTNNHASNLRWSTHQENCMSTWADMEAEETLVDRTIEGVPF